MCINVSFPKSSVKCCNVSFKDIDSKDLPSHINPFPLNPGEQEHVNDPGIFVQSAFRWQLLRPGMHSLVSKEDENKYEVRNNKEEIENNSHITVVD